MRQRYRYRFGTDVQRPTVVTDEVLPVPFEPGLEPAKLFAAAPRHMSGADVEAVLVRASRRLAVSGRRALDAALLEELIRDSQSPAYPIEIEYQRLIASARAGRCCRPSSPQ